MTFSQLYREIKKKYDAACDEVKDYFTLRTLAGEIWRKYGFSPAEHIINPEKNAENHEQMLQDADRALSGYPLQYVVGKTEFWNCEFYVGEGVLIPRSDTELAVEKALERLGSGGCVYDLCCGSGCIGISVVKNSDAECFAFDISPIALEYTRKNSELNGVSDRMHIIGYDIMSSDVPKNLPMADVIISNPPYIRTDEMESLPSNVRFEPSTALEGGEDGADFYRRIIADFTPLLKSGGYMIFEIAPGQAEILRELFKFHGYDCDVFSDYHGNLRVACGKNEKNY